MLPNYSKKGLYYEEKTLKNSLDLKSSNLASNMKERAYYKITHLIGFSSGLKCFCVEALLVITQNRFERQLV